MDSPLPLSEAEHVHVLKPHMDGGGVICDGCRRAWRGSDAWREVFKTFDRLRADLTAAQAETVEWQARALTESAKRIEEIKERDRTYLAVQKAWEAERDSLVSKEAGK